MPQPTGPNRKISHWTPSTFSTPSFSTKNIRLQLHGDAELTIARLHPHHARLALEGPVFEIEEKPDRVSDRIFALCLKENPRCADVARGADPFVQLHRQSEPIAFSDPSLLKTASSSHSAAQDASDPSSKQLTGRYIFPCCSIYIER